MLPKIIVTGFANSGTSFMTELVSRMGFSPGSMHFLKRKDRHNRYGYWEHVPMRRLEWQRDSFDERQIPSCPVEPDDRIFNDIARLANTDGIEAYKATTLPWTYPWFGAKRAVLIRRSANVLYERYYRRAGWSMGEFRSAHTRYHDLAAKYLDATWNVLWVEYESFFDNTRAATTAICEFLDRPFTPGLLRVWRPR